ncbi:HNH endonuclease [Saccharothrix sp. NPDC042600]|uniref:HNH endonuclease signature motif containing protein n=1 Tax=Saccharothrix TaxID=2071 RepID=UPI0033CE829E
MKNPKKQRNDVPDVIHFIDPKSEHVYDHQALAVRARDHDPSTRSSPPSVKAIADYLGMDPVCIICWKSPVERAHVVPKSLGGSYDVRNFALLCAKHHKEAPDVADAEAFWSWVDYACERDGHEKWSGVDPELLARAGIELDTPRAAKNSAGHWSAVRAELITHYGWAPEDFSAASLDELMEEFHTVFEGATTTHFGVAKKASTEAWAFEIARRRIANRSAS